MAFGVLPSPAGMSPICSRWCQRGAACVSFRQWTISGKMDLRLGRVPSRKIYAALFSSKDRHTGGQKADSETEAPPPA
jgi:hypothetical protein